MDNLSLMALTLSVGFVVDDAIVVLENIVRHIEMGEKVFEAALNGTKEIGFTILSMTISLAAVFIPLLFMGGIIGRLFREFAVTIAVAILVSGFVSLTLTPMLCARYLKAHDEKRQPGRFYQASERVFDASLAFYERGLRGALRQKRLMLAFSGLVLLATIGLFWIVPKGFIPSDDTGQIFAPTEAAQGISFEAMVQHQQAAAEVIRGDPNVEGFMSSCGNRGNDVSGGNTGRIFMRLKPRDERTLSADQIIQQLRPRLAQIPGIRVYPAEPAADPARRQRSRGRSTSSRSRRPTRRTSTCPRRFSRRRCAGSRVSRTSTATSSSATRPPISTIDRDGRPRSA